MGKEYELKFAATPQIQQAVLNRYPGDSQEISMETTYYDNENGDISRMHCTLRRRLENGRSVCTLKTPGQGFLHGEWEVDADGVEQAVPLLLKAGAPQEIAGFLDAPMVAICGARFTRIARLITLDTCTVELACDQGILTGGGKTMPLCEIEAELKSGDSAGVDSFGAALQQEFGLQPEYRSKFCRANSLYKGETL